MSIRSLAVVACASLASCVVNPSPAARPMTSLEDAAAGRTCVQGLDLTDPQDCSKVQGLLLPETLPPARGNQVADAMPAVQLGFQVFYDMRFAGAPGMRCASCHVPEKSFVDDLPVSLGNDGSPLRRNSQSIFTAAWNTTEYFWDGRVDSLWSQSLAAMEEPTEMAGTRLAIAHVVTSHPVYRPMYEAAFGAPPDLSDEARFPASGKPGEPSFEAMAAEDQVLINRIFSNVGKAIEAYVRKVATGRGALDRFLLNDVSALNETARRGLATFVKAGCTDCHGGPTLSDGLYHDMKVPPLPGAEPDEGRAEGLAFLEANPFNARGPYFDEIEGQAPPEPTHTDEPMNAFRTPSLRDVALTGPYGHNGYYQTLEDLLADHGPNKLSKDEIDDLVVFFLQLNGQLPDRPWGNWPTN